MVPSKICFKIKSLLGNLCGLQMVTDKSVQDAADKDNYCTAYARAVKPAVICPISSANEEALLAKYPDRITTQWQDPSALEEGNNDQIFQSVNPVGSGSPQSSQATSSPPSNSKIRGGQTAFSWICWMSSFVWPTKSVEKSTNPYKSCSSVSTIETLEKGWRFILPIHISFAFTRATLLTLPTCGP